MSVLLNQAETDHSANVRTPNYVLLFDKEKIGPAITDENSGSYGVVVYGFTDEIQYRNFMAGSQRLLMPYPLVKTYLRDQLADGNAAPKLVVVDAGGPLEPRLSAVTMEALLNALEEKSTVMAATHLLEYVEADKAYRVSTT